MVMEFYLGIVIPALVVEENLSIPIIHCSSCKKVQNKSLWILIEGFGLPTLQLSKHHNQKLPVDTQNYLFLHFLTWVAMDDRSGQVFYSGGGGHFLLYFAYTCAHKLFIRDLFTLQNIL